MFKSKAEVTVVDSGDQIVFLGGLMGAILPFLFVALTMFSVQKVSTLLNLLTA